MFVQNIEKPCQIVNLVSSRPRVSKLEFFVALALVALAQSGKGMSFQFGCTGRYSCSFLDVSIEQVAALSSQNTLPEPRLDLDSLKPSVSTLTPNYRQNSGPPVRSPAPAYASDDPWSVVRFNSGAPSGSGFEGSRGILNGAPSSLSGSGMPKEWWKKQEKVNVTLLGQQGFILNRYMVYEVITEVCVFFPLVRESLSRFTRWHVQQRGGSVPRRYSEFVFLWECLTRRYPFRLFPALPPKRIGREFPCLCWVFVFHNCHRSG